MTTKITNHNKFNQALLDTAKAIEKSHLPGSAALARGITRDVAAREDPKALQRAVAVGALGLTAGTMLSKAAAPAPEGATSMLNLRAQVSQKSQQPAVAQEFQGLPSLRAPDLKAPALPPFAAQLPQVAIDGPSALGTVRGDAVNRTFVVSVPEDGQRLQIELGHGPNVSGLGSSLVGLGGARIELEALRLNDPAGHRMYFDITSDDGIHFTSAPLPADAYTFEVKPPITAQRIMDLYGERQAFSYDFVADLIDNNKLLSPADQKLADQLNQLETDTPSSYALRDRLGDASREAQGKAAQQAVDLWGRQNPSKLKEITDYERAVRTADPAVSVKVSNGGIDEKATWIQDVAYLRDDTGPTLKIGFVVNLQKPAAEETALTLVYTRMSPDPQTGKYPETNVLPEKVVIAPGQSSGITWIDTNIPSSTADYYANYVPDFVVKGLNGTTGNAFMAQTGSVFGSNEVPELGTAQGLTHDGHVKTDWLKYSAGVGGQSDEDARKGEIRVPNVNMEALIKAAKDGAISESQLPMSPAEYAALLNRP